MEINHLITQYLHEDKLGHYWDRERYIVQGYYSKIDLPFKNTQRLNFQQKFESTLQDYMGYFSSWSSYQKLLKKDPPAAEQLLDEIEKNSATSMASGKKKRRTEEENREFNWVWTESFAFIYNTDGLPTCLICYEKLAHNKKSNLERNFTTRHIQFARKYPTGDARKTVVEELQKKINSQVPC
ncbi:unnamed protein product [Larinioides sclopetarius]|uniref:Uncharacterized protein n=1 Tax=Larinioides sclopetarius TaxID=280406 RepID=A0AAV1ZMT2_9ARAC